MASRNVPKEQDTLPFVTLLLGVTRAGKDQLPSTQYTNQFIVIFPARYNPILTCFVHKSPILC